MPKAPDVVGIDDTTGECIFVDCSAQSPKGRRSVCYDREALARVAQQCLNAGLVDEMHLHQVPVLLGGGQRLFDTVTDLHGLALVETVAAPNVTHLKFARK